MSGTSNNDDAEQVYNQIDDSQFSRDEIPESDGQDDVETVGDVVRGETDQETTKAEGMGKLPNQVDVPVNVLEDERQPGDDYVIGVGGGTAVAAAHEESIARGVGAEFGRVWASEIMLINKDAHGPTSLQEGSFTDNRLAAIEVPDGQTKTGLDRIAAREGYTTHIREMRYEPTVVGGIVDDRQREEMLERHQRLVETNRTAVTNMSVGKWTTPTIGRYAPDDVKEQARRDAPGHRAFGAAHTEGQPAPVDTRWTADANRDRPARRADEVRQPLLLSREVATPPMPMDPDGAIDKLTVDIFEMVATSLTERFGVGRVDSPEPEASDVFDADLPPAVRPYREQTPDTMEQFDNDIMARLGISIASIRRRVQEHYPDDPDDEMRAQLRTIETVQQEVFYQDDNPLGAIQRDWPAATTRAAVTRVVTPDADNIEQVVYVEPLAPNDTITEAKAEFAKVTIWSASDLDIDELAVGDIVHLKNVKPGRYGNVLTLGVTSDSYVDIIDKRPAPTRDSDADVSADADYPGQDLSVLEDNPSVDIDYSEGPPSLHNTRLRLPEECAVTGDLDWRKNGAEYNKELAHKDPVHTIVEWQFRKSSVPQKYLQTERFTPVARTIPGEEAPSTKPSVPEGGDYVPKSEADIEAFRADLNEATDVEFTVADEWSQETILEAPVADERDIRLRIYTTVVGEHTVPAGERRVLITIENIETHAIGQVDRFNRTGDWLARVMETVQSLVEASTEAADTDDAGRNSADTDPSGEPTPPQDLPRGDDTDEDIVDLFVDGEESE